MTGVCKPMTMPFLRCFTGVTRESFLLIHNCSKDFVLPKWGSSALLYAVWSSICSIYTLAIVICTGLESGYGIKIFIWLTYWSFYCLTLRFIFTACNAWFYVVYEEIPDQTDPRSHADLKDSVSLQINGHSHSALKQPPEPDDQTTESSPAPVSNNGHVKKNFRRSIKRGASYIYFSHDNIPASVACQWFLQNVSNTVSLLVTILFWALVYTGEPQTYISINIHVINSLLVVMDIMISCAPIRIQHFHMPVMFLAIYVGFTLIYWAAGGTNHRGHPYIYNVLDYTGRPVTAAVVIIAVALLAVPLTQAILYCLTYVRNALCTRIKKHYFTSNKSQNINLTDIVAKDENPVCTGIGHAAQPE